MRVVRRKDRRLRRSKAIAYRRSFAAKHGILFDPVLGREQIILPAQMSFSDNHEATADILRHLRERALKERRRVMLHFSDVERIDADVALVLVSELHRIRNLRSPLAVMGTYPRRRAVYELLREMGFYRLLSIEEHPDVAPDSIGPSNRVYLPFITGNRVEAELVDRFVEVVENNLFAMNEVARGRLVAAIIEAMNNTLDHAHPTVIAGETMTNRWWLSSWVDAATKAVTVMLFDQGVGIPATLDPSLYEKIRSALRGVVGLRSISLRPSDGEMILAATELHRTGTGQAGRGKGFLNMKRFIDACDSGELKVLSNRGRYSYLDGTESHGEASCSIGGTVIEWRFRHEGKMEMADE